MSGSQDHPGDLPDNPLLARLLEEDMHDLYEAAPCGFLSTTLDGTIVKINATLTEWLRYTKEDLLGRPFQELLTSGGRIYHETHYAPLLRMQGEVRALSLDLVRADDSHLPVLLNSSLKTDADDNPVLIRTIVFDATDRREYERELLRARRAAEAAEARARTLSETLQRSLLPPTVPDIPGLDVSGAYRPAGTGEVVGGDFYDVFETAPDDWAIVVGDVSGKGAEAAVVTGLARYTLRAAAMRDRRPAGVLSTLNDALLRDATDRLCTASYARVRLLRPGLARCTVSSGGHPLPVFVPASGPAALLGQHGMLLGVIDVLGLSEASVDLASGDTVVLYTDGVTEGRFDGEHFGQQRLIDLAKAHRTDPVATLASAVVDSVVEFQAGLPRDDVAVVAVRALEPD